MSPSKPRRSPRGAPSTDLILSVKRGTSADIFPDILRLHVPAGGVVADTTYGQGVFWRKVPEGLYDVRGTDLMHGVDARELPYADRSLDAVVFDPPWLPASSGETYESTDGARHFEDRYRNNQRVDGNLTYTDAILSLYCEAAVEALRVLKPGAVYIVKAQDQVHANKQWFLHAELLVALRVMGFVPEDLFVLVRPNRPGVSRLLRQAHARKAHSYFLVFRAAAPRVRARTRATPGQVPAG